jgi:hypothetical protein
VAGIRKILGWVLASLALAFGAVTAWVHLGSCPYAAIPSLHERFRPSLSGINSVDAAMRYLPHYYPSAHPDDGQKVEAVNAFVQDRFYHDVALYRPCDNWIARLAGRFWVNLALPVLPDNILKYPAALCSQQAIVAQTMLKRLGISYASVGFTYPGHFTPAARIDGMWYFFDPDTERPGLTPLSALAQGDTLRKLYPGPLGQQLEYAAKTGGIKFRNVNSFPGPRGAAFDAITGFFSNDGWALFAALFVLLNLDRIAFRLRRRGSPPKRHR